MNSPQTAFVSRRSALARLGGGSLGLALAARGFVAAAQEASPAATPGTLPSLLAEWAAAWSAHDVDRILALYAADAVHEEIPTNTVARGHDEIGRFLEFNFANYSDIEVRPVAGFQADGWAVFQGIFAGRYTGQVPGLPPGEGQAFAVPFASIFALEGGMIQRSTDYFDAYLFLVQIGALPAPGGAEVGTPTP